MAADFTALALATQYATLLAQISDRDAALALGMDPATTTVTNPLTNAIRYNSANKRWEKHTGGGTYVELIAAATDAYAMTVTGLRGGTMYGANALAASATLTGGAGSSIDVPTLKQAGSAAWTAATLTNLNQLTNGPAFITATALSPYAPLASPTLTGVPLAPTAAVDTSTTQLATTQYVVNQGYLKVATAASTYLPLTGGTLSGALTATSFSGPHNGTVGATTPSTGAFTTLSASGTISVGNDLELSANDLHLKATSGNSGFEFNYTGKSVPFNWRNGSGGLWMALSSTGLSVTGALSATGGVSGNSLTAVGGISGNSASLGVSGTQDMFAVAGQTAGTGPLLTSQNYNATAYAPLTITGSSFVWKSNGSATVLSASSTGLAVTGALSASGSISLGNDLALSGNGIALQAASSAGSIEFNYTGKANAQYIWRNGSGGLWMALSSASLGMAVDIQLNAQAIRWDQSGVRSWYAAATGGNMTLTSGDGNGQFNFGASVTTTGFVNAAKRAWTSGNSVSFSATPTFDASASNFHTMPAMTASVTSVTLSNAQEGQFITIRFTQDATGGRTITTGNMGATNAPSISGSPSTTANKASYLNLTYNATAARWEGSWLGTT